jgi:hypothetical protein
MPQGKGTPTQKAKDVLAGAQKFTESVNAQAPAPKKAAPKEVGQTLAAKAANMPTSAALPAKEDVQGAEARGKAFDEAMGAAGVPKMHEGGVIPEDGVYNMKKGEKVTPADGGAKPAGRQSEYRKVFMARQQKRSGGGNAPVAQSAEKHDLKRAEDQGQPNGKKAGAHVKE